MENKGMFICGSFLGEKEGITEEWYFSAYLDHGNIYRYQPFFITIRTLTHAKIFPRECFTGLGFFMWNEQSKIGELKIRYLNLNETDLAFIIGEPIFIENELYYPIGHDELEIRLRSRGNIKMLPWNCQLYSKRSV